MRNQSNAKGTPVSNENDETLKAFGVTPVARDVVAEGRKAEANAAMQSAYTMAAAKPRDQTAAVVRIKQACERYTLSEKAFYAYPRGREIVRGLSIRAVRVLAQCWGNLHCGIEEVQREGGRSLVRSYARDLETNYIEEKTFWVDHKLSLKDGGVKILTDSRDIYELCANYGTRRLRSCILAVIPDDIREAAEKWCIETKRKGNSNVPLVDRIRKMAIAFQDIGVAQEMIEKRLGHKIDLTTEDEFSDLQDIWTSLNEGETARDKWFAIGTPSTGGKAAELAAKLDKKKETPAAPTPFPEEELMPFEKEEK